MATVGTARDQPALASSLVGERGWTAAGAVRRALSIIQADRIPHTREGVLVVARLVRRDDRQVIEQAAVGQKRRVDADAFLLAGCGSIDQQVADSLTSGKPDRLRFGAATQIGIALRERIEQHRASPACAGCHKIMDPIGLAMENFDAVGRWRTIDEGVAIDASGQLVDGTPLNGPASLRTALLDRQDVFVAAMTEKLMMYGVGRETKYYDMPAVRAVMRDAAKNRYRFSDLVLGVVKSAPFQMKVKS